MSGYTKLFGSILDSSVWMEPVETRVVWITMLAKADRHGVVSVVIPKLAQHAGVSIEAAERAIECFLSPDKYSRTKAHEGRRIVEVEEGWRLLNHAHYRRLGSAADRAERDAVRYAAKVSTSAHLGSTSSPKISPSLTSESSIPPIATDSTYAEADAEAEATHTPIAPLALVVDESLRFPEPGAANFNTRDLERAVLDVRGTEWRIPSARHHQRQAAETAAHIMSFAAARDLDPCEVARRAFAGWLASQKSVDPMVWCANWASALPAPPPPERPRVVL